MKLSLKGFALFPTELGTCGIAWSGHQVLATSLPGASEAATAAHLAARTGATQTEAPHPVRDAMSAIASLLRGEKTVLEFIACDFGRADPFARRVYDITRTIAPGETTTYGAIAHQLGNKLLARKVGQALGRNPLPIIVPCHRVIGANARLTGFSAPGGVETKLRMLAIEDARIGEAPGLFGNLPLSARPVGRALLSQTLDKESDPLKGRSCTTNPSIVNFGVFHDRPRFNRRQ